MRTGFAIGDVFEVETAEGFGYIQIAHQRPVYGSLVRVLPGLYRRRPADLADLVSGEDRYLTFVPVYALVEREIGKLVGRFTVPENRTIFPVFKVPFNLDREGTRRRWWLWDGDKE